MAMVTCLVCMSLWPWGYLGVAMLPTLLYVIEQVGKPKVCTLLSL